MTDVAGALFFVILAFGVVLLIDMLRERPAFWPGPVVRDHHRIFRIVHREDRAAYRRMMRRTVTIQMRDMSRAMNATMRQIGKALLPPLQAIADAVRDFVR